MSRSSDERIAAECHCIPLRMVHRVVTGLYDEALRPFGLRAAQLNVLVAVAKLGDDASAAQVARYLSIEKSTLSRDLERMAEHKWVETGRALKLTRDGRRLVERALPAWERAQAEAQALLGRTAVSAIRAAADRIRTTERGERSERKRGSAEPVARPRG
jgi:DNA-binding MarR family transcriptional regulator